MDIDSTIDSIEFKNFTDIICATVRLVSSAIASKTAIQEKHYKKYETHIISSGLFKEDSIEELKIILRNQFAHIQSTLITRIEVKAEKSQLKAVPQDAIEGGVSSVEELVAKGLMTKEEANIKPIETPAWIAELNEEVKKYKDMK